MVEEGQVITMSKHRYRIPSYSTARNGYDLEVEATETLFESHDFDAIPDGWRRDPGRKGEWKAEGGRLIGEVAEGDGATLLWYQRPIAENHAIAFRATIAPGEGQSFESAAKAPLAGEILAYWNGDGRSSGARPWSLALGALDGWRGGYSGLGYRTDAGGGAYAREGTVISDAFDLTTSTTYDVFAGRLNEIDFLFGAAVDAEGNAAPPTLVGQAILGNSGMTPPNCHYKEANFVALGTAAFAAASVRLSVEHLAVYQIPDAAVSDWK